MIPLYNYGHFLTECVDSVLDQEHVEVDVLIIDDASTDDSLTVARALASTDPRVTVSANERNLGLIATINAGMWAVDGEYVVKMDADDILTPGALARATALLDADDSLGFVYGFPVAFSQSPPPLARTRVRSWTVWEGREWLRIRCCKGSNCIMQPEAVIRTAVLHRAGPYNPEFPLGHDFEMWLRLAALANVGRVNGAHQGYYRIHEQSMQRQVDDLPLADLEAVGGVFASVLADVREVVPDAGALDATARRAVAARALRYAWGAFDGERAEHERVNDYLALAAAQWPALSESSGWQSLERRRQIGLDAAQEPVARAARRSIRDLENRLRWRRWRWSGV